MTKRFDKPIERILILSGGGARGAYEVGACRALADLGWAPDMIVGNSIGATNGAILAAPGSGGDAFSAAVDLLEEVWRTEMVNCALHEVSGAWHPLLGHTIMWVIQVLQLLEKTKLGPGGAEPDVLPEFDPRWTEAVLAEFDPPVDAAGKDALRWFLDRIRPYLKQGIENNPSLIERGNWQKVLERHVNWKRLNGDQARCYLGCTATDVETGTLAWFWNHAPPNPAPAPLLKDAGLWVQHAMASSSIWSIYPSTVVDDRWYWDGALLANTPVQPAVDLLLAGKTDLDVVVVLMTPFYEGPPGLPVDKQPSVLDGLVRFMDWMMLGTFREQLARLDAAQRERVRIVAPNRFQGVVQMIDYAPGEMRELRRQGEEDAWKALGP